MTSYVGVYLVLIAFTVYQKISIANIHVDVVMKSQEFWDYVDVQRCSEIILMHNFFSWQDYYVEWMQNQTI